MAIRFKLNDFLEANSITPYRLSKDSGVSLNTVYAINKDSTKRIDKETLYAILNTLEELTGKSLEVSDLVAYEREKD